MLDFTIFIENKLRMIPLYPAHFSQEHQRYVCSCFRQLNCHNPGKHPLFKDWQSTPAPTAQDIPRIKQSKAGFAIAAGNIPNSEKKLVIIDVDLPGLKDPLIPELPHTVTIRTRSGGLHFYYTIPKSTTIHNLSTGYIDIRSDGGFVLCPPSEGYDFVPSSALKITHLQSLPAIPRKTRRSQHHSESTYTPNLTQEGLIPVGERDYYVFSQLRRTVEGGLPLSTLLSIADTLYTHLEQPTRDIYSVSQCREKAYYVHSTYSDPKLEALRATLDELYPVKK